MDKQHWEERILSRLDEIKSLAEEGLDDDEIAKSLGLSAAVFRRYRARSAAFSAMLDRVRATPSQAVESALFQKALGYTATVLKQYKVKRVEYDPETGKKRAEYEEMVPAQEQAHVSADLQAQMLWLTNRKPDRWSQKPQHSEGERRPEGGVVLMPEVVEALPDEALPEEGQDDM